MNCQHWTDCGAFGCCGLGVYTHPTEATCKFCLRREVYKTNAGAFAPQTATTGGCGSELKKLLRLAGITSSAGCKCNLRATDMDKWGAQWCEENIPLIVSWLKEEATKRKIPFLELGAKALIKLAIRNAKRKP